MTLVIKGGPSPPYRDCRATWQEPGRIPSSLSWGCAAHRSQSSGKGLDYDIGEMLDSLVIIDVLHISHRHLVQIYQTDIFGGGPIL